MAELEPSAAPLSGSVYGHVGRRLRELRLGAELTQAQVARLISVSPQQYQKYEEAHSKISLPNLLTLADHYGSTLNDMLPGASTEPGLDTRQDEAEGMSQDADLLARLVSAFVRINDSAGKLRLVQLVETMAQASMRADDT